MTVRRMARMLWPVIAGLCPAIPLQLYFAQNWYSVLHSYSLGMVAGILSYTYFCVVLVLSARIRYFDRLYGHDRVLVFHGYLALTALLLALVHRQFKTMFIDSPSLQTRIGTAGLGLFGAIALLTVFVMLHTVLHRMGLIRRFRVAVLRVLHLDYTHLKAVHNFMSLSLSAIVLHVLMASPTAETLTRSFVMGGMGAAALLVYGYHKALRPLLLRRRPYTLTRIDHPNRRIVTLTVEPRHKMLRRCRAGQFVYLRVLSPACGKEEHPFTLSSSERESSLSVTVKELGDYTSRLQTIEPGPRVLVDGPYGVFTPEVNRSPYLFIAGGIGMTPFLAIIRSWQGTRLEKHVTLLWSVRTTAELIYRDVFDTYAQSEERFAFVPVVTGADEAFDGPRRISTELMKPCVTAGVQVYLCGPEGMRKGLSRQLRRMGVSRRSIHYERFSF